MIYYLLQLYNGNMLCYDSDKDLVFIEYTGYPYNDCEYNNVTGQVHAFYSFLEIRPDYANFSDSNPAFFNFLLTLKPISKQEFKIMLLHSEFKCFRNEEMIRYERRLQRFEEEKERFKPYIDKDFHERCLELRASTDDIYLFKITRKITIDELMSHLTDNINDFNSIVIIEDMYLIFSKSSIKDCCEFCYKYRYNLWNEEIFICCKLSEDLVRIDFEILDERKYGGRLEDIPSARWDYKILREEK